MLIKMKNLNIFSLVAEYDNAKSGGDIKCAKSIFCR